MKCPSCHHPLKKTGGHHSTAHVWCGWVLSCKSQAACDGADGETFEQAYERLKENVDKEALIEAMKKGVPIE